MKINLKKGFTLIELLVVVAIIVVLASLNSARTKGSDAAIKANLANMRAEAAIYYDTNSNYGGTALSAASVTSATTCPGTAGTLLSDPQFCNGMVQAASTSGNTLIINTIVSPATWVAGVALKSVAGQWQCVDSAGSSKTETTSSPSSAIVAATTICP